MKTTWLVPLTLLLAGCGGDENDGATAPKETAGAVIANDYNEAMDKARHVENLGFEAKDRMDAAVEAAEGNGEEKP